MLLGVDQRSHQDFSLTELTRTLTAIDNDFPREREKVRDIAESATDSIKRYNKTYKDSKLLRPTQYREGDYVCIRNDRVKVGEGALT